VRAQAGVMMDVRSSVVLDFFSFVGAEGRRGVGEMGEEDGHGRGSGRPHSHRWTRFSFFGERRNQGGVGKRAPHAMLRRLFVYLLYIVQHP